MCVSSGNAIETNAKLVIMVTLAATLFRQLAEMDVPAIDVMLMLLAEVQPDRPLAVITVPHGVPGIRKT